MSEKRRPRTATALVASALLHLSLAALVLRGVAGPRSVERRATESPASIEIELREWWRAAPAIIEAAAPPQSPGPPLAEMASRPRATPGRPATPAISEPARPSAGLPAPPPAPRAIDLSFGALAADARARATAEGDHPTDLAWLFGPAPAPGGRRPLAELRAEAERRTDAEKNVRDGRADPFLFDVLRDAQERLTPEATRIAERLPLGPAETTSAWGRGYLGAVAEAQGGAFTPLKGPDEAVGGPFGGPHPDVLGASGEAQRQAEAGAEARTTEICVAVAPHHPPAVTLRRSSGNAALDRLATDSFRAAGDARPVAPDLPPSLACYRVRIGATRVPPLPTVSIDVIRRRVILPLQRLTKVTVELESVDLGPKPRPASLLHAP